MYGKAGADHRFALWGVTFLNNIDLKFMFKDTECVRMQSGKYSCVIAPKLGAAVLRLRDEENGIEVFRYRDDCTLKTINKAREIWGLPTLFRVLSYAPSHG
jgi:aldose 1-epimerase